MAKHALLSLPLCMALAAPVAAQKPAADPTAKLIEVLTSDDSYKVRLQAAVFLGRSDDDRAVEPLIRVLAEDEHYTVRAAAANGLANLGNPTAIAHIVRQAAVDTDAFVRKEGERALRKYDREEALTYVVATYGSEDPRVRKVVVVYLSEGPVEIAEVVLSRAMGDVPEIHEVAKIAIAKMTAEQRLRFLANAIEHRDPSVRRGAVDVLRAEQTIEATQSILKVYERDIEVDQVRNATREALRDLRRFLPIDDIIKDARVNADKHVRARALKLLGVIGGEAAQAALVATLQDEEVYLRGTAVMALRELGNPGAITDLEKLLRNPQNQRIALQIRTAVKHLKRRPPP